MGGKESLRKEETEKLCSNIERNILNNEEFKKNKSSIVASLLESGGSFLAELSLSIILSLVLHPWKHT